MKFSKLFFFFFPLRERRKKERQRARVELCFALKGRKKNPSMFLNVLTTYFQILEEVFSCDMEGDTATQTSVIYRFFLMVSFGFFVLFSFVGR